MTNEDAIMEVVVKFAIEDVLQNQKSGDQPKDNLTNFNKYLNRYNEALEKSHGTSGIFTTAEILENTLDKIRSKVRSR